MRSVVFTCTKRPGGLDVTEWGLSNQTDHESDIVWVIGDELYQRRKGVIADLEERLGFPVMAFDTSEFRQDDSLFRTVAHSYSKAMELARQLGADMFVSLQDYIVIPPDGISRFEQMYQLYPDHIYSGLCSFATEPTSEDVVNSEGMYTVFDGPFEGPIPTEFSWADCRHQDGVEYAERPAVEWEANWSAVPGIVLNDPDVSYNTDYDFGVAYENQGYSFAAERKGYTTIVDMHNHAVSLDHKSYFPWEEEADLPHLNEEFHRELWGL